MAPATATQPMASTRSSTIQVVQPPVPVTLPTSGVLRLRPESVEQRHIQWADDVIDNENMGKKSSKVCCIYHRPHAVDESSDSDYSSSDSSSGSESDSDHDGRARPVGGNRRNHNHRHHKHSHSHDGGEPSKKGKGKAKAPPKRSSNAYERVPKYQTRKS